MKKNKNTKSGENQINVHARRGTLADLIDDNVQANKLHQLIAQQSFSEGLSVSHLQKLTKCAMKIQFEPGQQIFKAGDPSNRFYLILEGRVEVESKSKEGDRVPVGTLGPGDHLGWSWLFPPHYMQFGMRAIEPTKAIFFYGTRLRQQCEDDHDLGYEIMKRFAELAIKNLKNIQQILMERANIKGI